MITCPYFEFDNIKFEIFDAVVLSATLSHLYCVLTHFVCPGGAIFVCPVGFQKMSPKIFSVIKLLMCKPTKKLSANQRN